MRLVFLLLLALSVSGPAAAQDRAYVQIEARPSLIEAQARARAYAGLLPLVNGFALDSGWYGVALGPYDTDTARATLQRLLGAGAIPRDSYVSDGGSYRDRFWPVGAGASAPAAPPVASGETLGAALPEAGRQAIGSDAAPAVDAPAVLPAQTLRQAQAAEADLTRRDREDLQVALQWFGYYDAAIDGSFGSGTRASMAAWQTGSGFASTGVLTTAQRARLMSDYAAAQAELGLVPIVVAEAGISLTAPMGLVEYDRTEAPFVHYVSRDDSGVRMSLISQAGDAATLGGLYEILQTLDLIPRIGDRSRSAEAFSITGVAPDRTTQVEARLQGDHIVGFLLSWPEAQDRLAARALPEMARTLASSGPALPPDAGFDASEQSYDMVSGLEVRRPLRAASGFFVDTAGTVVTAAGTVAGCGRLTLDDLHEARMSGGRDGVAILTPVDPLAPVEIAVLAPEEGRLRSAVSVGGFPYGGVLGAATLSFGTLEDVRGLDGAEDVLRLSLVARDGDAGGPVLDGAGRVAGMLLPDAGDRDRALPEDVAFARKSQALAGLLLEAGITPRTAEDGPAIAPEDLTARAMGMTVLVSCWE